MKHPVPINPQGWQESVWDYPRPPRLEPSSKHIEIICGGIKIADSHHAFRVLETSHPPVYYIPSSDVKLEFLKLADGSSYCEWKGEAGYYDLQIGTLLVRQVAWFYPQPSQSFAPIKDHLAFYALRVTLLGGDGCFVDSEQVIPQPGEFYGGWITSDVVGPFKGESNSSAW